MTSVVVTMAGAGSRFKRRGVEPEKYRLQVRDRTMFEFAMKSLRDFFDHRFVFVTQQSHDARPFVEEKCATLGISDRNIVEIDGMTSGQATTALQAAPLVDQDESVLVYNIDTYVSGGHLDESVARCDGAIPVFETGGGSWSFVKRSPDGLATDVVEKEPISNLASLGLYYFDSLALFESAFDAVGADVEAEYGERYVAPLYNWLIDADHDVAVPEVPASAVHILGTPEDVTRFDPEFPARYGVEEE